MPLLPARLEPRLTGRGLPLWVLYPVIFVAVYLAHITLLRLPYFWDEAGYYIPAALDFYRHHALIPTSTLTNAHPPLPSILISAAWHVTGVVISGTRTFVCMVAAAALLAVFRIGRMLAGAYAATALTILTGLYPIWFAQSTLAHADIFAAAFSLWALSFYLETKLTTGPPCSKRLAATATLFTLAALSKETAIVTPAALAAWELYLALRNSAQRRGHLSQLATLASPVLPLIAWYLYFHHQTGYYFGNPEFVRYNAAANLAPQRIALALLHRALHLTVQMNLYVPVLCLAAALLMPRVRPNRIPPRALHAILIVLIANWIAFSILGGALLTRYLLPLYPLVLLLCVSGWRAHLKQWGLLAALSAVSFLAALFINPPYGFAPEDNLTYRDMIVLHQEAIRYIVAKYPQATVLSAWPATAELSIPDLGYIRTPLRTTAINDFSYAEVQKAAQDPGSYDTALVFSTKYVPPGKLNLRSTSEAAQARYFDDHVDLTPATIALLLHGSVEWQDHRQGEWVAVLRFPRSVEARLQSLQ